MNAFTPLLAMDVIPPFIPVDYRLPLNKPVDPADELARQLEPYLSTLSLKDGGTVAIAAGSREINRIVDILRVLVSELKKKNLRPFIIPAMGSHGGATAEGQQRILESYGITEQAIGAPIRSTMETVEIGTTPHGLPVHIDRYAHEADYIIPVNRIKPHTDFRGEIESGVMKMLAIGVGKQHGASICHKLGFGLMARNVTELARCMIQESHVLFGVGIVEDTFHNPYSITVMPAQSLEQQEIGLLEISKTLIQPIPFEKVDVLMVTEMGKNLSGPGMDTNVTGRSMILGRSKPFATCITVLDLTDKSHGNFTGIGCADVTTQRLVDKMDLFETYTTPITNRDTLCCKLPMYMPNDEQAIRLSIHFSNLEPGQEPRIVWIRNTLDLKRFYISPSLLKEAEQNPDLTIKGPAFTAPFDAAGNLIPVELRQDTFWESAV